jgi:hypothetical protein
MHRGRCTCDWYGACLLFPCIDTGRTPPTPWEWGRVPFPSREGRLSKLERIKGCTKVIGSLLGLVPRHGRCPACPAAACLLRPRCLAASLRCLAAHWELLKKPED